MAGMTTWSRKLGAVGGNDDLVAEIGRGVLGGQTSLCLGRIDQEIVHSLGGAKEGLDHLDIDIRVGKDVAVIPDEQMGRHGLGAMEQRNPGTVGK